MCRVVDRDREIVRDHDFTVLYRSNSVVDHDFTNRNFPSGGMMKCSDCSKIRLQLNIKLCIIIIMMIIIIDAFPVRKTVL